ncbi:MULTISPECIES: serine protease [unclassified Staphylococcus]|uniref:S1C family serine protease n=1 Tax=unclassified Staphylococcus TaxID=91994 RepID=UPI0021CF0894|nr:MULTISPECIES: serine protease [unclassified Staphylococcus]UXR78904.1 trypsin-like peptidase domain-containing protein [Staphylococcus sp. IVB6227]UXR83065.1 trypsin-like peptidase domain-containing protein [Staphylococcus sp. IVB6214]
MDQEKKQVIPRRSYRRKRREFFHNEEREARIKEQQKADALKAEKEKAQAKNNEERVKDNLRKARIEKLTHEEKKTSKKIYKVNPTSKSAESVNVDSNQQQVEEEQPSNEQLRIQQDLYKQQANDIQREKQEQQEKDTKDTTVDETTSTDSKTPQRVSSEKEGWLEKVIQFISREWAKILVVLGALLILILLFSIFNIVNSNGNQSTGAMEESQSASHKQLVGAMKYANDATKSVVAVENNQEATPETVQDAEQQAQVQNESGSGVVCKKVDGLLYILTNAHVVGDKKDHTLTYGDDKTVTGTVIGKDKWSDIALMTVKASKVDEKQLKPFKRGNAEKLVLGESVLVVGNPLGMDFRNTVGQGIVSGLDRNVPIDIDKDNEYDMLVHAFQVDAPVNPGDSGGAVIDQDGKLIGIASLKISMPNVEGMAFAIPINDAEKIAKKLEKDGKIDYPNSKISLKDVSTLSQGERASYQIDDKVKEGAVVQDIAKDSPARQSGLKTGDVIVALDGKPTKDRLVYRQKLYQHVVKDKPVKLKVIRDGEDKQISFDL